MSHEALYARATRHCSGLGKFLISVEHLGCEQVNRKINNAIADWVRTMRYLHSVLSELTAGAKGKLETIARMIWKVLLKS